LVLPQASFYFWENEIHSSRTGKTKNVYRIVVRKLLSKITFKEEKVRKKYKTNLMNHVAKAGNEGDWHNIVSNNEIKETGTTLYPIMKLLIF
jgi:DNA/RNA endonuclease YhcR with UshA esterase domain